MRAEDILNALDHVDPALVGSADRKPRLWPKRLRRFAAAAACFALVLGLGFHTLLRFDYFRSGCSAWPGSIVDGTYYFRVAHSGLWRWSEEGGTEKLLSTYWYDGAIVNGYGVYFSRGRTLYVLPHEIGKAERLYTAPRAKCTHIGFSLLTDGRVDLMVYDKDRQVGSEYLLDGVTGAVRETIQEEVPYRDFLGNSYPRSVFQLGEHVFRLEDQADSRAYRLTVDGETVPLPDILWLDLYGGALGETGDYALLYARTADAAEGEDDRQILLCSDGTVHVLPYGERFLTGARGYLYSVDYTLVPADAEDPWGEPDRVPSGIRCYEITSGESWLLTADAELDLYEFVTDGDLFFTCVPWGEEQVAWRLRYDGAGRPVSLTQLSPNVAPEH
mgnify:FL=1